MPQDDDEEYDDITDDEEADESSATQSDLQSPLATAAPLQVAEQAPAPQQRSFSPPCSRLCEQLPVHAKAAGTSVPILLGMCALSAVLLAHAVSDLRGVDDTPPGYVGLVAALAEGLNQERHESIAFLKTRGGIGPRRLTEAQESVDQAIAALVRFHFDEGVSRLVGEGGPRVEKMGPLIQALKQAELIRLRNQVRQLLLTNSRVDLGQVTDFYEALIAQAYVIGGRRSLDRTADFTHANLGMLSMLHLYDAWGTALSSAAWLGSSSAPEALAAASAAWTGLDEADLVVRIFQNLHVVEAVDAQYRTAKWQLLRQRVGAFASARNPGMSSNNFDLSQVVFDDGLPWEHRTLHEKIQLRCNQHSAELFRAARASRDDDATDAHQRAKYARRVALLAAMVVLSIVSILMQVCNVWMYLQMEPQVRAAKKEVLKLEDSVERMQAFVELVEQCSFDTAETRTKGMPTAEATLYSVLPKVKEFCGFLHPAMLSETMRGFDPLRRPFTDFALHNFLNVTLFVADLEDLQNMSPMDGDPVKQKSLETQMTKFLSVYEGVVKSERGVMHRILSDCVMSIWNAFEGGPASDGEQEDRPQERACAAALRILAEAQKEVPLMRAGVAIATGDLLAGNVGMETLASFMLVGPTVPFARNMLRLGRLYDVHCLLDTNTAHECENYILRPVDLVHMEMGGDTGDKKTLYQLIMHKDSREDGDHAEQEQEKLEAWDSCFSLMQKGEIDGARQELQEYESRFQETGPIVARLADLIAASPDLPGKCIYDFLPHDS